VAREGPLAKDPTVFLSTDETLRRQIGLTGCGWVDDCFISAISQDLQNVIHISRGIKICSLRLQTLTLSLNLLRDFQSLTSLPLSPIAYSKVPY